MKTIYIVAMQQKREVKSGGKAITACGFNQTGTPDFEMAVPVSIFASFLDHDTTSS